MHHRQLCWATYASQFDWRTVELCLDLPSAGARREQDHTHCFSVVVAECAPVWNLVLRAAAIHPSGQVTYCTAP